MRSASDRSTSGRCGPCRTCSARRPRSAGIWRRTSSPPTGCPGRRSPGSGCCGSGARWRRATSPPPSVSAGRPRPGVITTLEGRKFVRRKKDARDGRMVLVSLTAAGTRKIEQLFPHVQRGRGRGHVAPRRHAAGCPGQAVAFDVSRRGTERRLVRPGERSRFTSNDACQKTQSVIPLARAMLLNPMAGSSPRLPAGSYRDGSPVRRASANTDPTGRNSFQYLIHSS